jgi:hypothetical protein
MCPTLAVDHQQIRDRLQPGEGRQKDRDLTEGQQAWYVRKAHLALHNGLLNRRQLRVREHYHRAASRCLPKPTPDGDVDARNKADV